MSGVGGGGGSEPLEPPPEPPEPARRRSRSRSPRDRRSRDGRESSGGRRRRRSSRSGSRSPPRGRSRSYSPPRRRRSRSYSRSRSRSPRGRREYRDREFRDRRDRYGGPPPPGYDDFGRGGYDPGYGPPPGPPPFDDYYPPYPPGGPFGPYSGPPPMPPPHGGYRRGGRGRRDDSMPGVSLLVRNVSSDITSQDLMTAFRRIGEIRDVYIPRDYHSQQPKGFAFIEYATPEMAREAQIEMDRFVIKGRELEVVFAQERRKTPGEMRGRVVDGGGGRRGERGGRSFERSSSFERHKQREREQRGGRPEGEDYGPDPSRPGPDDRFRHDDLPKGESG